MAVNGCEPPNPGRFRMSLFWCRRGAWGVTSMRLDLACISCAATIQIEEEVADQVQVEICN